MKSVDTLLSRLKAQDIKIWKAGGELRYTCPKGRMTPELKAELKENKARLLEALEAPRTAKLPDIYPSGKPGPHPLSFGQQRLWFLGQLEEKSTAYNMPAAWRVEGQLDELALEASLNDLMRRHRVLRSHFPVVDGKPVMAHLAPSSPLKTIDLTDLSEDARDVRLAREMADHAQTPFDLAKGPLFRVLLIKLGSQQILQFNIHHIISDGWTMGVLLDDWQQLYRHRKDSDDAGPDRITELTVQYTDYVRWQHNRLTGDFLARQLSYWKKKLGDAPGVPPLPPDFARPALQSEKGGRFTLCLSPELSSDIRQLSRDRNVTVFMTLMAAFKVLLYRYGGQRDLCVGSPVANRPHPETERMAGLFANTLVFRTRIPEAAPFIEILNRVRQTALEAYDHQDIPFEYLVEKLNPTRSLSHTPLFQVMFVLQQQRGTTLDFSGIPLSFMPLERPVSAFDLTLEITDTDTGFVCDWEYATALFRRQTIAGMAERFQVLLGAIVRNPSQQPADLPLMTNTDRQLMSAWNSTHTPFPEEFTVVDLFEAQADRTPDAVALVHGGESMTYRELNLRADRLARLLAARGVGPEVVVGLLAGRSPALIIGLLGILKAGGAYLPLDPAYPRARLNQMTADAGTELLLACPSLSHKLPDTSARIVYLDQTPDPDIIDTRLPEKSRPENMAYLIYTSGTSGRPKGVMVEHRALANYRHAVTAAFSLSNSDRVLQFSSASLDVAAEEIFPVLTCGGRLILGSDAPVESNRDFLGHCRKEGVTVVSLPTAYWQQLIASDADRAYWAPEIRLVVIGGEAADFSHIRLWQETLGRSCRLINAYGPTEATVSTTFHPLPPVSRTIPIGTPLPNTRVYILDGNLQPVPPDIPGELCIAGSGLARGYLNRPGLTAEKFIRIRINGRMERIYRTGDKARRRPDGTIDYLGRMDDQVQIRGFRVEPAEVASVLSGHGTVKEAVVRASVQKEATALTAYVTLKAPDRRAEEKLRAYLRERLPAHMQPASIVVLDRLPLTPGGKIDKEALPTTQNKEDASLLSAPPQTRLQKQIAAVWQDVLDLGAVGIHDNFFDLGGHSLLLIKALSRLQERVPFPLKAVTLFRYPTIAALAAHISETGPLETDACHDSCGQGTYVSAQSAAGDLPTPSRSSDIAVIGMACRFPGAANVDLFWDNLCQGVESVRFFSDDELLAQGISPDLVNNPKYVKAHGVLEDSDRFDAGFFGFAPSEAKRLDPQERIFMETAWTAAEHAGYDVTRADCPVGLFAGAGMGTYFINQVLGCRPLEASAGDFQRALAGDKDFMATRTAYKLNLQGPAVTLHTACSTSLVAVHMAVQSLRNGECCMALAGGVSITFPQTAGYLYQDGMIGSPDGHCRAFDSRAQGTVGGSGAGVVVLKRLDLALRDGDTVHAVIKGSAVNNDGKDKVGYTAPGIHGQTAVIQSAMAGLDYESVTCIEAHGTGTPLGDPVEIDALTRAFRTGTRKRNFCAVGSVKTNLGHLDTAAGVAGLIKTVMALKHGRIPPSLHFDTPNPAIDFHRTPFYVNTRLVPWQADHPRRAGVSSFGIGGTNAHVVLEEPPRPHTGANASSIPDSVLFCLSARTEAALERYRNRLADHLSTLSKAEMADTAYTLNRGRKPFSCRGFFIGSSPAESADVLRTPDAPDFKHRTGCADSPVIFMFPGQGARTRNWGQMLYDGEPIFRSALDNCARHLAKTLACNITEILYGSTANRAKLKETRFAQPALFATEYALACLYMDRSITPAAMIGHSLGEYVAATLAGVFSLEDALDLVALRGRLMQALPAGAMLSAGLSHADFPKALGTDLSKTELSNEELSVAAVNARNTCVISGPVPSIERAERKLLARNIQCRRLDTAHAFHSAMMAPMLEAFNNHLSRVNMNPPRRPYVSNLTGTWVTRAPDPADWCRHLRETVRFADGLDTLLEAHPGAVLVELGPGRALTGAARQHRGVMTVTALPEDVRAASLLNAFGQLWLAGATIQWHKFYQGESRRRRPVPTYPFEKERYWMEPPTASLSGENGANPCQSRSQRPPDTSTASNGFPLPDQRFYVPVWQREIAPETTGNAGDTDKLAWLIFADPFGLGDRLAASLEQTNARVVTVTQKNHFTRSGERSYTLDSGQEGHYNELFSHLSETGCLPDTIVHLWGVDPTLPAQPSRHLTQGFYSLVYTARALWRQSPQKKCRIHVITDQVQAVTGTEVLSPEKSAVLGPVRVIPQEYPNITCRCIDIEISRTDAQSPATGLRHQDPGIRDVANRLLGQIMDCAPPLPVSAIRGPFLWHQTFAETPVPDTAAPDTGLRREGVYLITGGLGGMGMVIARYLAQRVRARLALVSRTPFPPRHQWHEILRSGVCRHLDTGTRQRVVEEMTDRLILETDLDTQIGYPDVTRDMDTLCTVYIRAYLAGGIDTSPGRCYDRSHLISTLGLEPRFEKFFDAMLATLEEDGIIRRTEDQVEFLTTPPLDDIDALCSRIADAHPGMAGDLDLLAHCVSHYPATLSGQTPAIEVLYPNGQTSLLARAANSPGAVSDRFCIRLVREILAAVTAAGPDKKLKILEVGGGNGGLTRSLKGVLDRHNAEYHFTDLGNYFVVNARRDARAAGDGDWMHFDVLDISKAPGPQGYSHGTFDIILGFNVVHAVPRVRTALGHLKSLLAPRGMLCLVETVTQHRWTDMVWGLTEGWWSFEDHEIRQGSPLLSTGQWEEVLRQEGFENIRSYSGTTDGGADPETALILARTPEVPDSPPVNTLEEARNQSGEKLLPRDIPGKARWLLEMENLGSRVMVINADAGDPEAMAKVHQKITDDFGRVHGIIHAAGIEGGGAIQVDAPSTAALEFTAKITGTRVIEKVFGPDNPDFFMLCSSHNSLLGGPGQVGYAAANAFLDTYAHARSRDGGPLTVSVNWDRWQGVGMAAKVEATHLARTSRPLTGGLTASEGTDAFHRILAGRRMPQVVVSKTDFEAQLQHRPDDTARRKGPQAGQPNAPETKEGHCRPNLTTPYLAPRYALEKTMAELWQEVLGMASVGIHDDFHELGGDSLMATRVVSRLREAMDVDLTVRDLLERPTIADLAAHLTATLVAPAPDETTDGYCEEEEL